MTQDKARGPRVNEQIRVPQVRVVIDSTGEQLGILPTFKALELAQEHGLDLVEVADNARPPVCKIMDYGAYKFKKAKAAKEAKKASAKTETKEMRFTSRTADHDLEVKSRKIKEFLEEGHKVLLSIKFKGRERAHSDLGRDLFNKVINLLGEIVAVESPASMDGDKMTMVLARKKA